MKKIKKKTKMGYFKVHSLLTEHGSLPKRPVYSMDGLFLTIHSLFSAIFSLFQIFAPIQMYTEYETTGTIPT